MLNNSGRAGLAGDQGIQRLAPVGRFLPSRSVISPTDYLALASVFIIGSWLFALCFKEAPQGDAAGYIALASQFSEHGFPQGSHLANLRTYGYPLFLVLPVDVAKALSIDPRLLIFPLHMALYVSGAWLIRQEVAARLGQPTASTVFMGMCLNFFVLIYMAEPLTDGLTVALILWLVWIIALLPKSAKAGTVLGGSLLVGAMIMIRPGNIFLLPFWGVAVAMYSWRTRWFGVPLLVLAAVGVVLPIIPQSMINASNHGTYSPFPSADTTDLRLMLHSLGILSLKYVTLITDETFPLVTYREPALSFAQRSQVFYQNPFKEGAPLVWPTLHWYLINPARGFATIGLHIFGLLDHDIIFPYSRSLVPAYRWPVGVINHAMIGLSIVGFVHCGRVLSRDIWRPALLSFIYLAGFFAIYAFVAVEARFGLPLIAFSAPLAALGVRELLGSKRLWVVIVLALYIGGALSLSEWVRDQAPAIRMQKALMAQVSP